MQLIKLYSIKKSLILIKYNWRIFYNKVGSYSKVLLGLKNSHKQLVFYIKIKFLKRSRNTNL